MPAIINNFYGTYVEHIETYIQNQYNRPDESRGVAKDLEQQVTSCIFTKKAIQEGKEADITQALRCSLSRRNDKARALVEEVRYWQKDGYIDPNYNARVMYDALNKIIPLPFQYDGFRKYYNE